MSLTLTAWGRHVALTPDGARIFLANFGEVRGTPRVPGRTISVVDTSTMTFLPAIDMGNSAGPEELAVSPDAKYLFGAAQDNQLLYQYDISNATQPVFLNAQLVSTPNGSTWDLSMTPSVIVPGTQPFSIATDGDLEAYGFRQFVSFWHGTLRVTGPWVTDRIVSLLADTAWQSGGGTIETIAGVDATIRSHIIGEADSGRTARAR